MTRVRISMTNIHLRIFKILSESLPLVEKTDLNRYMTHAAKKKKKKIDLPKSESSPAAKLLRY